jgi:UDP-N-acetyl-D-mannosaminuronic acid dehydrogenase
MLPIDRLCVQSGARLSEILLRIDEAPRLGLPGGIALVVDEHGRLTGTITEGDIRRALLRGAGMDEPAERMMTVDPVYFDEHLTIAEILERLPEELARRGRRSKKYLNKIILVNGTRRPTRVVDYHHLWEQRVATHRHVVVVGLGYVGLTLALVLADEGFMVTGVDVDRQRVQRLARGESYVHEIGLPDLLHKHIGRGLKVATEMPQDGDVYVIAVGTPVAKDTDTGGWHVDTEHLHGALDLVASRLRPGNLVVLRSTVPAGTCSRVAVPHLVQKSGLRAGFDFHLSFAPERTAEGKALRELRELPQIIGGYNSDSVEATAALFRELTPTIVRVGSLEAAEMAKLVNNSFRDLVFAFSNEMAQVSAQFDLDIVEVINAANKGYVRDPVPLPSPGVGGPCLTKDPYILASASGDYRPSLTLFEHSRQVNERMIDFVVHSIMKHLTATGKDPASCRVLACGLAFKGRPETGDLRDSTAIEIVRRLQPHVGEVIGHDPVASVEDISSYGIVPVGLPNGFDNADAVLLLNNHPSFERINVADMIERMARRPLVYDGWQMLRADDVLDRGEVIYAGLSYSRSTLPVMATPVEATT